VTAEPKIVLAIETSCDETAVAVVRGGTEVLSNVVSSQVDLHAEFGGVVPEVASRAHLEILETVTEAAMTQAEVTSSDLDAVAATCGPGLIGALLIGVSAAKAMAMAWNVPYVGVNHMEGHLFATFLEKPDLELPLVVLLVSGGHTMIVEVEKLGRYRYLGSTIDDAAGEAFDKVARYLGLGYPGGPIIDPEVTNEDVAASFQAAVVDVLVDKTLAAAGQVGAKTVCIGGGVAANSLLRSRFAAQGSDAGFAVLVPDRALCTDNAAMIAAVAHWRLDQDGPTALDGGAYPSLKLPTCS